MSTIQTGAAHTAANSCTHTQTSKHSRRLCLVAAIQLSCPVGTSGTDMLHLATLHGNVVVTTHHEDAGRVRLAAVSDTQFHNIKLQTVHCMHPLLEP